MVINSSENTGERIGMKQKFSIVSGVVENAVQCPSPNFNERPSEEQISLLVIHNISLPPGEFGGGYVERFFQNQLSASEHPYFEGIKDLAVSSHLFISREGGVTQFVNLDQRAWHAGRSEFDGRVECNDYSIGIELEGTDLLPYTDQQYGALEALSGAICEAYPQIAAERITGHEDIAPTRKTDPGPAFDWPRFRAGLTRCL